MIHASSLSTCKITLIRIKYKRIHDNRKRNSPLENTFQRRSSFDNNETRALVISITGDPSSKIRPHDVYAYCTDACETLTVRERRKRGRHTSVERFLTRPRRGASFARFLSAVHVGHATKRDGEPWPRAKKFGDKRNEPRFAMMDGHENLARLVSRVDE